MTLSFFKFGYSSLPGALVHTCIISIMPDFVDMSLHTQSLIPYTGPCSSFLIIAFHHGFRSSRICSIDHDVSRSVFQYVGPSQIALVRYFFVPCFIIPVLTCSSFSASHPTVSSIDPKTYVRNWFYCFHSVARSHLLSFREHFQHPAEPRCCKASKHQSASAGFAKQ